MTGNFLYSPSLNAFYNRVINAVIPQDAVPVTDAEHANLMSAQTQGQVISAAGNGQPQATAPAAPTYTQQQLVTALVSKATDICNSIVAQVFPDPIHQAALTNAAMIITGNAGVAPTTGPLAAKLAALAATYQPSGGTISQFAALVNAVIGASMDLSTALAILTVAADAAGNVPDLQTALTTFQGSISTIVTTINASSPPVLITAPSNIYVTGINQ